MGLSDLIKSYKNRNSKDFNRRLDDAMRYSQKFKNLDDGNKKVLKDLIGKYDDNIREGRGISSYALRQEKRRLYKDRLKSDLTKNDLDDIEEVLEEFKK